MVLHWILNYSEIDVRIYRGTLSAQGGNFSQSLPVYVVKITMKAHGKGKLV